MRLKADARGFRMSLSAVAATKMRGSYGPITSAAGGTSTHEKNGQISTMAAMRPKVVQISKGVSHSYFYAVETRDTLLLYEIAPVS